MKTLICTLLLTVNINLFAQFAIDEHRSSEITSSEMYAHIDYLASKKLGGRLNGTNGDRLAQQYISRELSEYGCTPIGDSAYLQFVNLFRRVSGLTQAGPIIIKRNKKNCYLQKEDVQFMLMSSKGTARGQLVFAGFGRTSETGEINDLLDTTGNEVDVRGKVLIIIERDFGLKSQSAISTKQLEKLSRLIKNLSTKGPSGIIVITSDYIDKKSDDILIEHFKGKYYFNSGLPVINIKRTIIKCIMAEMGYDLDKIQHEMELTKVPHCIDITNTYIEFEDKVDRNYIPTANVVGFIEGSDTLLKKEVIVIGAHYDHVGDQGRKEGICFGADDNASGTSGVLEIAQKLCSTKEILKRSVMVILFGAEEGGLNGSEFFTQSDEFEKHNIIAMINLDMIGRLRDNSVTVYGSEKHTFLNDRLFSFNEKYNLGLDFTAEQKGRSDQKSFMNTGIPILAFFTNLHEDYHTPNDIPSRINYEGAEKITNLVYEIVFDLSTSEKLR